VDRRLTFLYQIREEPRYFGTIRMDATRRGFLTTAVTAGWRQRTIGEAVLPEEAMISTCLTQRFGIMHPIICAPMALVTGGALAAAVSRAGGLGVVGEPSQERWAENPIWKLNLLEQNRASSASDS